MQVGTLLSNRYRIDAQLGEGGMGVVYRAHDALLDRAVASETFSRKMLVRMHIARYSALKRFGPQEAAEDGVARVILAAAGVRVVAMGTTVAWR